MRVVKRLAVILERYANSERHLFLPEDFRAVLPELAAGAFRAALFRAERDGLLSRVCRGVYLYGRVDYPRGLVLYHAASRLRANHLNYISLETALSDMGAISQILMNRITIMSSGRTALIDCGAWGTIEFVHTKKTASAIAERVIYDDRCRMWRAAADLAFEDLKATRRNLDLVDRGALHEPV